MTVSAIYPILLIVFDDYACKFYSIGVLFTSSFRYNQILNFNIDLFKYKNSYADILSKMLVSRFDTGDT